MHHKEKAHTSSKAHRCKSVRRTGRHTKHQENRHTYKTLPISVHEGMGTVEEHKAVVLNEIPVWVLARQALGCVFP